MIQLKKSGKVIKAVAFTVLLIIMIGLLSRLVTPHFVGLHYERHSDFYNQPEDTLEMIFLGSSVVFNDIIPAELYEDYGICSYNLGTDSQPLLASYYWLLETYDYHSETLSTVVLDTSMFKRSQEEVEYQKAFTTMRLSLNKYHAVRDISDNLDDFLTYMFPLVAYHTRWTELEEDSFDLAGDGSPGMRGYNLRTEQQAGSDDFDEIEVPSYAVDSTAGEAELYEESLIYLEKIVSFCEEKGLDLLLIRTPTGSEHWTDEMHNAMQSVADDYGLTFLDMNYSPYLEEIGFCGITDRRDDHHLNYYGAVKLTAFLGEYFTENYDLTDVRGDENYAFMEEELEAYQETISARTLNNVYDEYQALLEEGVSPSDLEDTYRQIYLYELRCEDEKTVKTLRSDTASLTVSSYLEAFMDNENLVILIASQGDSALSDDTDVRSALESLGLTMLSRIEDGETYAALIKGGEIVSEICSGEGITSSIKNGDYKISSSGDSEKASIKISGTQYSPKVDGLNIVVYDKTTGLEVDAITFGTDGSVVTQ